MIIFNDTDKKKFIQKLQAYKQNLLRYPMEAHRIIYSLIENSTRIEGSTLTRIQVENMLKYAIEPEKMNKKKKS